MSLRVRTALFALALACASTVPARSAPPAPNPCANALHHQFDFWLGDWNVVDRGGGKTLGHNTITREFGGCVLQEHWTDAGDHSTGSSFNAYDAARRVWHQTWVDTQGQVLVLDGGLRAGSMVLSGRRPGRNGAVVVDRITWTPQPDKRVRQHWQMSRDGGTTWRDVFDGYYTKAA